MALILVIWKGTNAEWVDLQEAIAHNGCACPYGVCAVHRAFAEQHVLDYLLFLKRWAPLHEGPTPPPPDTEEIPLG